MLKKVIKFLTMSSFPTLIAGCFKSVRCLHDGALELQQFGWHLTITLLSESRYKLTVTGEVQNSVQYPSFENRQPIKNFLIEAE